jgi:hypothetical protein
LIHGAGFLCHIDFRGSFGRNLPVFSFWYLGACESTAYPYPCAQLLLNSYPWPLAEERPRRTNQGPGYLSYIRPYPRMCFATPA